VLEMSLQASYSLRTEVSERRLNIFMFKGSYVRPSVGDPFLSLTRILISLLCQNCLLLRHKCTKCGAPETSKTERSQTKRPRTIYDSNFMKKYHCRWVFCLFFKCGTQLTLHKKSWWRLVFNIKYYYNRYLFYVRRSGCRRYIVIS